MFPNAGSAWCSTSHLCLTYSICIGTTAGEQKSALNFAPGACYERQCQEMVAKNLNSMDLQEWLGMVSGPWTSIKPWGAIVHCLSSPKAISISIVMTPAVVGSSRNGGLKRQFSCIDLESPEDELRDLLTYTCSITGETRCPPCLHLDFILVGYTYAAISLFRIKEFWQLYMPCK